MLEVTAALAADLRQEFYPEFEALLGTLAALLSPSDVEQLEDVFSTLCYLFKCAARVALAAPAVFPLPLRSAVLPRTPFPVTSPLPPSPSLLRDLAAGRPCDAHFLCRLTRLNWSRKVHHHRRYGRGQVLPAPAVH